MRIVIVDPRGDTRPYDDALCEALARRGHEVELVSCRYPHTALEPPEGVRLAERFYRLADRLPPGPRRYARGVEHPLDLAALLPALRRHRPDVIHVQWLPMHGVDRTFWRARLPPARRARRLHGARLAAQRRPAATPAASAATSATRAPSTM